MTRKTLDSGERVHFDTGAQRDVEEGKQTFEDVSLSSWNFFMGVRHNQPELKVVTTQYIDVGEDVSIHLEPIYRTVDGKTIITGYEFFSVTLDVIGEPAGIEYAECLVDPLMLNRLQALLDRGAEKYDKWNWRKGIPTLRFFTSALRHLLQWRWGDTTEDHLAAVIFNAQGAMRMEHDVDQGKLPSDLVEDAGSLAFIP